MAKNYDRFNDGSNNPPRLRVEHSLWALSKLPMNAPVEWTLDEKFSRAKAAGFEAIETGLTDDNEKEIKEALDRHGLRLVMAIRAFTLDAVRQTVERAVRVGADLIWMQPADAFTPLDTVVELVREGRKMANDQGLPLFIETHRNNFTETLPATLQLLERVPDMRFTADLSHFVLVGEFYGWPEERAAERLAPILERVSHMHGRISDGEAAQVDVGDGSGQTAQFFVELWSIAMRHWLAGAGPGDVLPFASELGPPRYALTLPDGREYSDRWEQSLVMKKLAEKAWAKAQDMVTK